MSRTTDHIINKFELRQATSFDAVSTRVRICGWCAKNTNHEFCSTHCESESNKAHAQYMDENK